AAVAHRRGRPPVHQAGVSHDVADLPGRAAGDRRLVVDPLGGRGEQGPLVLQPGEMLGDLHAPTVPALSDRTRNQDRGRPSSAEDRAAGPSWSRAGRAGRQDWAGRTGPAGLGRQDWAGRTGPAGLGRQDWAGRTGPAGLGRQDWAGRTGPAGLGRQDWAGRTGPAGQGRQDRAGRTGPAGQGRQDRAGRTGPGGVRTGLDYEGRGSAGGGPPCPAPMSPGWQAERSGWRENLRAGRIAAGCDHLNRCLVTPPCEPPRSFGGSPPTTVPAVIDRSAPRVRRLARTWLPERLPRARRGGEHRRWTRNRTLPDM